MPRTERDGEMSDTPRCTCRACFYQDGKWQNIRLEYFDFCPYCGDALEDDGDINVSRDFTGDPVVARILAMKMSAISEYCYCAGWLDGLEFSLWHTMQTGPREWGQRKISQEDIDELKLLSELCDGWVHWVDGSGETFVDMETWLKIYAQAEAEREELLAEIIAEEKSE